MTPEEHYRAAGAAFQADDLIECRRQAEAAFRGFRDGGDLCAAGRVAISLAELHDNALGNAAAGRGWLDRARRALEEVGPCVEWGYYELAYMACDRPDVDELEASADRALAIALEFHDHNLEVRALADGGLALVTQGRVREGFDRLDSAMAAISAGEVDDFNIAGKCFCSMLSGCERVGDVNRVDEWVRVVHEAVSEATGGPPPKVLATHCLVAYGSVLATAGRFEEAEAVMTEALSPSASRNASHRLETTCNLARVRLEQGRVAEAAALLAPYEDRVPACEPIARLRLLEGEPELAAAAARRGLNEMQGDVLRASKLLARVVEAEIALGNLEAADDAADELGALADRGASPTVEGEAALAAERVAAARGDHEQAIASYDKARAIFSDRPFPEATARVALAESLATAGEGPRAIDEARAAAAVFERIGANGGADRAAALLRQLGAPARVRSAENQERAIAGLSARELEVLDLVRQGNTNAEIATRLYISPKTAEHHVSRILNKLGVRTRAEAAALAATATRPH